MIEGVHLRSDGFKELPSGADTGFYRNEWMLKGSYNLNPSSARNNELGLKLVADRAPLRLLVIDRIERPSEN